MKQWLLCLILGISLAACSSTPIELPSCVIPAPLGEVGHPVSVPEMPQAISSTADIATFDFEGILQLERVRQAGLANARVAEDNALAIESRNEEVNQFIECARYSKIWMEVREDMLEQEKWDHAADVWWLRGLIALGVAAVAL